MSAGVASVEEAWVVCITQVLRPQRREQQGGRLGPVVHHQLAGLAGGIEVHDDEVVNLDSVRVVGLGAADAGAVVLQEEIAAHAVEAEVLKRVEAPRKTQHLPNLLCATQFAVEYGALKDDIVSEVVQPVWVVIQVLRLVFELADALFGLGHGSHLLFTAPARTATPPKLSAPRSVRQPGGSVASPRARSSAPKRRRR